MPKAIVDLSPTITEDFPTRLAGAKAIREFGFPLRHKLESIIKREPFYIADSIYTMHNHLAPHYDPPTHLIEDAKSGDQVPLDKFYGKARLFDFRSKPRDQPLLAADFKNQPIEADEIVIVFVGYTPPADPEELPSYPYLSKEAAEYLLGKSIKAVATDMPSLGSVRGYLRLIEEGKEGAENIFPEHYVLLSNEIPVIEVLTNLERLVGENDIVFVGFPLKFEDSNGSPLRPAALLY